MSLKLSVLDQSAAAEGRGQDATIRQTLALAEKAEAWGYHRFWVSEHHSHPSIVGTAPEVLMAAIAARTQRIRIGSAGVGMGFAGNETRAVGISKWLRIIQNRKPKPDIGKTNPFDRLFRLSDDIDSPIGSEIESGKGNVTNHTRPRERTVFTIIRMHRRKEILKNIRTVQLDEFDRACRRPSSISRSHDVLKANAFDGAALNSP
jgi:hypothetical protein